MSKPKFLSQLKNILPVRASQTNLILKIVVSYVSNVAFSAANIFFMAGPISFYPSPINRLECALYNGSKMKTIQAGFWEIWTSVISEKSHVHHHARGLLLLFSF